MTVQLYTLAYVRVDGAVLTEEASVQITRATNSQAVNTVANGYSGESPGAPTVEIDVTNAVPAAGFERNMGEKMVTPTGGLQSVEIGLYAAGKVLTVIGFVISDSFKHSVNSESTYDFKFRGRFEDFV